MPKIIGTGSHIVIVNDNRDCFMVKNINNQKSCTFDTDALMDKGWDDLLVLLVEEKWELLIEELIKNNSI